MIEHKTTHISEAAGHLVNQFRNKPKLGALLESFSLRIQDAENMLFDIQASRAFNESTGIQLDRWGEIVGEAREGRSDLDYKTAIRARTILNFSHGQCEDIISLLIAITNTNRIRVTEYFPAGFVAQIVDPIDPVYIDPSKIQSWVSKCRGAGIMGITLFGVIGSFRYDSGPGYDRGKYGGAVS